MATFNSGAEFSEYMTNLALDVLEKTVTDGLAEIEAFMVICRVLSVGASAMACSRADLDQNDPIPAILKTIDHMADIARKTVENPQNRPYFTLLVNEAIQASKTH